MDSIDDILREVDPAGSDVAPQTRDLQRLTRLWVAERSAPELLAYVPPSNPHVISFHIASPHPLSLLHYYTSSPMPPPLTFPSPLPTYSLAVHISNIYMYKLTKHKVAGRVPRQDKRPHKATD